MTTPMFPYAVWASGTTQNSIPANDNSLRNEIIHRAALAIADAEPGSPVDGDVYIVGTAWGGFSTDDVVLYRGGLWYGFQPFEGWLKWLVSEDAYFHYTDSSSGWALFSAGGGGGDVVGPASSVADRIAVWDGTTGKLLKDGGKTIAALRSPAVQSVTSASTVTPTFADDFVKITAQAAALALANPSGTAIDGWGIVIRIKDNGTARAITYGTQYRAVGVTLPTTTTISKTLYLAGIWNTEDTKLDIIAARLEA